MSSAELLYPAVVLALWTWGVVIYTGVSRMLWVRGGQADARYFSDYQGTQPRALAVMERHVANLFETPMLFYVVIGLGFVSGIGGAFELLAWTYVAARLAHSLIHLGPNHILARLIAFLISMLLLLSLWLMLARHLIAP